MLPKNSALLYSTIYSWSYLFHNVFFILHKPLTHTTNKNFHSGKLISYEHRNSTVEQHQFSVGSQTSQISERSDVSVWWRCGLLKRFDESHVIIFHLEFQPINLLISGVSNCCFIPVSQTSAPELKTQLLLHESQSN